jgi:hypothetical protein
LRDLTTTARLIAALVVALAGTGVLQESPLDRPLTTTEHLIYAPPGPLTAPSDASEFGLMSRIARTAAVPFGFESDPTTPRPSVVEAVEPHYVTATTLRAALDGFIAIDKRYQWRDMSGVYVVRPAVLWAGGTSPLNLTVHDIDWKDLNEFSAFNHIARLLYPRSADVYGGITSKNDRPFDVKLQRGTVLDVLNAVARADGELGWGVRYGGPSEASRFILTLGHYGNGPTHSWRELPDLPADAR